jgi:hypothetical protein
VLRHKRPKAPLVVYVVYVVGFQTVLGLPPVSTRSGRISPRR